MKTGNPSDMRQYYREFVPAMLAYMVVLIGVVRADPQAGTAAAWLWLLPALPLLAVLWAILRQYERCDEFYKRIHSESFALGAIVVGAGCMIYGFAENAGLPRLPLMWVAPALLAGWGLSLPVVLRRYR